MGYVCVYGAHQCVRVAAAFYLKAPDVERGLPKDTLHLGGQLLDLGDLAREPDLERLGGGGAEGEGG